MGLTKTKKFKVALTLLSIIIIGYFLWHLFGGSLFFTGSMLLCLCSVSSTVVILSAVILESRSKQQQHF